MIHTSANLKNVLKQNQEARDIRYAAPQYKNNNDIHYMAQEITDNFHTLTNGNFRNNDTFRQLISGRKPVRFKGKMSDSIRMCIESPGEVPCAYNHRGRSTRESRIRLAQEGYFDVGSATITINNIVRQYGSTEAARWSLSEFFVDEYSPTENIVQPVLQRNFGMLPTRPLNEPFPIQPKQNYFQEQYSPFYFGGGRQITESELISFRNYGSQDISQRGLAELIIWNELALMVQVYQRIFNLQANALTIGNNDFITQNVNIQTNYATNANGQQVTPIYGVWGFNEGGALVPNPNSRPLSDIWYWVWSYEGWRRFHNALVQTGVMVMNPNTYRCIMDNPNTRTEAAFQVASAAGVQGYSLDSYLKHYFPQSNLKVVVDGTMLSELVVDNVSSMPQYNDTYVYPDGYVNFLFNCVDHGATIGKTVFTPAVQAAGGVNPASGIWTAIADLTSPQSVGGAQGNPYINILVGFNGMVMFPNPDNILSALVI